MAKMLREKQETPYERLTVWNQDANNCAGHGTARAIEAFMLKCAWTRTRHELVPFEAFVPWIWGVGKNEAGNTGTGGASMGEMLSMITKHGILPNDTLNLPQYKGTSNRWAARFGKGATNAPYSQFWPEAKKYIVTAAQLPKDDEAFYLACKAGFTTAFGTSQKIVQVQSAKFKVQSSKFKVQSAKCKVQSAKCKVQSAKCKVERKNTLNFALWNF